MTCVSVSDCRPNYLSVTNCSAALETVSCVKFKPLICSVQKTYVYCYCMPFGKLCNIMGRISKACLKLPS